MTLVVAVLSLSIGKFNTVTSLSPVFVWERFRPPSGESTVAFLKYFYSFYLSRFAVGMLFRGLNTSLIQLLSNFYANFAVRELVSLFGYAVFLVFVTW